MATDKVTDTIPNEVYDKPQLTTDNMWYDYSRPCYQTSDSIPNRILEVLQDIYKEDLTIHQDNTISLYTYLSLPITLSTKDLISLIIEEANDLSMEDIILHSVIIERDESTIVQLLL